MTPPGSDDERRKALLDEYAALRGSATAKRLDALERLLGIGRYKSDARRAKGG